MTIKIQNVNFEADKKLMDSIEAKLSKLQTYHDKIIDVEVFLKLDNIVHQIKDKVVEIKVNVPKHTFFCKNESKHFEESFEHCFDSIANQLKKQKEKALAS